MRIGRIMSWVIATLLLAGVILTPGQAHAVSSVDNALLADTALRYVGRWGGEACRDAGKLDNQNKGTTVGGFGAGQCRTFVNCVVQLVTGKTPIDPSGDYFQGFLNIGGAEVTSVNDLVKGDVVQYGQGGHTFIIVSKVSSGTFRVVDSNWSYDEMVQLHSMDVTLSSTKRAFRLGTVTGGSSGGTASSPYPNGSYITSMQTGAVYVMAGGSPLRVASWANVGGAKPVTAVGQPDIDSMPPYPADGTYVQGLPSGRIFVFAGGAPLIVSNWNNVGAHPFTGVDDYALDHQDHTRLAPVDGTFINALPSGRVYVFAGGAPLRISNWNNVGGVKNGVGVDDFAVDHSDHMNTYPADGTYVNAMPSGRIMVFAGGGALQVASWSNVGGFHGYTTVDDYPIDHQDHVRQYPADGTTITGLPSGNVYVVAGGAPMRVSNWGNIGGVRPFVAVDDYGVAHQLRQYPLDNTFVVAMPSGRAMAFAGGAAMRISSWSNMGGVRPYTTVDDYPIDHLDHVLAQPTDGTVVAGWPSGNVYMVAGDAPLRVSSWSSIGGTRPFANIDDWAVANQMRAYPSDGTLVQGYASGREYLIQGQLAVQQSPPTGSPLVVDDWAIDNQLLVAH